MSEVTIGDLVRVHNSARVPIKSSERVPGTTPYYGASGIVDYVDGWTHDGHFLLVSEDGENLRSRSTPVAFRAEGRIWVNNHAHVLSGLEAVDTRFLEYALAHADISGYLTGSAQPKLTLAALRSIRLAAKSLDERRGIADVLGALDDAMVAREGIVNAAEQLMARIGQKAVGSVALSVLADHRVSLVPPSELPERMALYSLPAFDSGARPSAMRRPDVKSGKLSIPHPSVLIAKLNPRIPRIWDVREPGEGAVASTEFVVLEPRECSTTALWAVVVQPEFIARAQEKVSGTSGSHQRLRPSELLDLEVSDPRSLVPPDVDLLDDLGASVEATRAEIARLKVTRDELLPLLMSGRVTVREAQRAAEEAV